LVSFGASLGSKCFFVSKSGTFKALNDSTGLSSIFCFLTLLLSSNYANLIGSCGCGFGSKNL
jgi:hypothetical protein